MMRDERGMAMPVAIAMLLIMTALASAAALVAIQTNDSANNDSKSKTALGVADAGLRAATYRLSVMQPDDNHCVTSTGVAVPSSGPGNNTYCANGAESLGNGSSFQYWMTIGGTNAPTACAGNSVVNQSGLTQRCITAIGTVNGVTVRTQQRVAAFQGLPLFPAAILGLNSVSIANNANINGTVQNPALVATNGTLTVGGGTTTLDGTYLGPSATISIAGGVTNNGPTLQRTPAQGNFLLAPVDPGTSNQGIGAPYNDDNRICTLDPCSKTTWNPITRSLSIGNNGSISLGGGTYNFCDFSASNNAHITVGATVQTRIFIDSPYHLLANGQPACPLTSTGSFTLSNNDTFDNQSGNALNVQLYVYGNPNVPGQNTVSFYNNSNSFVTLYAPNSTINLSPSNNTAFTGAIAGWQVSVGNASHFTYFPPAGALQARTQGLFFRTAWEQCPAKPTNPSDPASGC